MVHFKFTNLPSALQETAMPLTLDQKINDLLTKLRTWSNGVRQVGMDLGIQMDGKPQTRYSGFYLQMLRRHVIILDDIQLILVNSDGTRLIPVFALARCLLDDFILLIHLAVKDYDEEEINKFEAKQWSTHFSALRESAAMNHKYFDGVKSGMYNNDTYQARLDTFRQREENHVYFSNAAFDWKSFPTTRDLVVNLPETELGKANAHAFILWKYFSNYVHFSPVVSKVSQKDEFRYIELKQLKEVMSYCFKGIFTISEALTKKYHIEHAFNDPQGILDALHSPLPE